MAVKHSKSQLRRRVVLTHRGKSLHALHRRAIAALNKGSAPFVPSLAKG